MARKRRFITRQALVLAFAAGALTGAASALTMRRRRQDGDFPAGDVAGQLGESAVPLLGERFDGSPQNSISTPAIQHN